MSTKLDLKNRPTLYISFVLVGIILLFALISFVIKLIPENTQDTSQVIELNEGWQYRWQDPAVDGEGMPNWDFEDMNDAAWKEYKISGRPLFKEADKNIVWYRVKIPENSFYSVCVYFEGVLADEFSAYSNDDEIFSNNINIDDSKGNYLYSRGRYVVQLPASQNVLTVRVTGSRELLGIYSRALIGDNMSIIRVLMKKDIDNIILGFFFTVLGLVILPNLIFIEKRSRKVVVYLSLFITSLGLWNISQPININFFVLNSNEFWIPMGTIAAYMAIIFFLNFFKEVFTKEMTRVAKFFKINMIILIVLLLIQALNLFIVVPFSNILTMIFYMVVILNFAIQGFILLKSAFFGNIEAKVFCTGFIIYATLCIYEISHYMIYGKTPVYYKWGMLIFVACLILIVGRRFAEAHEKLKDYSAELESKNLKLNEALKELKDSKNEIESLNASLETRVMLRTRELQDTLEKLIYTQEQLIQSEKMAALGGMVAGIAHEINTPVGISVTAASHLDKEASEINELYIGNKVKKADFESFILSCRELISVILTNLRSASELIKSFKRVAVDQSYEDKRVFNFSSYIDDIITSLSPEFKKVKHKIKVNCPSNLVMESYPGHITQVLSNLILNSLTHAFNDDVVGNIDIEIKDDEEDILIKYSDDGIGIDSENINKIFEPFFTTKRNKGGSGLGLNIVYNIVTHKLHGSIQCESKVGVGTSFEITIPKNINKS